MQPPPAADIHYLRENVFFNHGPFNQFDQISRLKIPSPAQLVLCKEGNSFFVFLFPGLLQQLLCATGSLLPYCTYMPHTRQCGCIPWPAAGKIGQNSPDFWLSAFAAILPRKEMRLKLCFALEKIKYFLNLGCSLLEKIGEITISENLDADLSLNCSKRVQTTLDKSSIY